MKQSTTKLNMPTVRSDALPGLRRVIATLDPLKQLFGSIVEFTVVVDANILIEEILWRLTKLKKLWPELAYMNA